MTFNNMDVSNLLCKMERLHSEMCALRHSVKLQAEVGEDLRSVTSIIDRRVAKMECQLAPCVDQKRNHKMSAVGVSSGSVGQLVGASAVESYGGELAVDAGTVGSLDLGCSSTDVRAPVVPMEATGDGSAGSRAEATTAYGGFKDNAASSSSPK